MSSEYAGRRWSVYKDSWDGRVVASVDAALAAQDQRDVLGYLDYIRGATDQLE